MLAVVAIIDSALKPQLNILVGDGLAKLRVSCSGSRSSAKRIA